MAVPRRSVRRRSGVMDKIDAALFAFAGLSSIWLAFLLLQQGIRPGWPLLLLVAFWILFTYLLLPRLHRILTHIYVPGYFIGRTRTGDGLLGDPVNIALLAHEGQIHQAMLGAGWIRADDLNLAAGRKMVAATLTRRSYPNAPVSPLLLFDRQQDFAYQQEVGGSTAQRHHVRFWRCPEGWMLPGGYAVDWLAAGTYDRSVGFSLFTFQITHKIEANTDIERDFVVRTVTDANPEATVRVIEDFSTGYHSRNGGGDLIQTDGDLPILDLRAVPADLVPDEEKTDSRDKRPVQTVFGSGVAVVRGLGTLAVALTMILTWDQADVVLEGSVEGASELVVVAIAAAVVALAGLVDIGLGLATFVGRNWARLILMFFSVISMISAFVSSVTGVQVVGLAQLPTIATGTLVLLALSSHRAREFAVRGRHHPQAVAGQVLDEITP
ncbi:MAG TPA: LssY C-terminal domain-containing protein [Microlunatus sp.]|nr:LssY C-terminal domain-containing protein [Microlunatus sp.]